MTTFLRADTGLDQTSTPHHKPATRPDVFGQQLRRARQRLNLSIEEIAERIKLDPRQITALEEERFDELPGMAFVRGFTRQYARILSIDETPLLNLLPAPSTQLHIIASHLGVVPPLKGGYDARRRYRFIKIFLILVLGIGLILTGLNALHYRLPSAAVPNAFTPTPTLQTRVIETPVVVETPVVTSTLPATPAAPSAPIEAAQAPVAIPLTTTPAISTTDAPASPASSSVIVKSNGHLAVKAPASVPPRLELSFEERSWVEVKDSRGRLLLSQMNQPGSRQSVNGVPPYDVTIGNPHAVTVQYKGATLDVQPYTEHDTAHITLD